MELNKKLAAALAQQYLAAIDPQAMAAYLLTPSVAVALLTECMRKNPTATIGALQQLPARTVTTRKKAAVGRSTKRPAAKVRHGKRRRRMGPDAVQQLKNEVTSFLAKNRWATRKQLTDAVALDTQASYRRIMTELQQDGLIVSKGEKSKAVYSLKGRGASKTAAKKKAKKKSPKKSVKSAPEA